MSMRRNACKSVKNYTEASSLKIQTVQYDMKKVISVGHSHGNLKKSKSKCDGAAQDRQALLLQSEGSSGCRPPSGLTRPDPVSVRQSFLLFMSKTEARPTPFTFETTSHDSCYYGYSSCTVHVWCSVHRENSSQKVRVQTH